MPLQPSAVIQLCGCTEQTHVLGVPEGRKPTPRVMDGTKRFLPSPWVTAAPCRCAGAREREIVGHVDVNFTVPIHLLDWATLPSQLAC